MDYLQYSYASSDEEEIESESITANHNVDTSANANANANVESPTDTVPVSVPVITAKRILANPAPPPTTLAILQHNTKQSNNLKDNNNKTNNNKTNNSKTLILMNNPLKSQLLQPIQGPDMSSYNNANNNTNSKSQLSQGQISTNIQHNTAFDHTTFEMQRNDFQRSGIALGPNEEEENVVVRTTYGHERKRFNKETDRYEQVQIDDERFKFGKTIHNTTDDNHDDNHNDNHNNDTTTETATGKKRKRNKHHNNIEYQKQLLNDSDDEINYGIWGPPTTEMKQIQNDTLSTLDKLGTGVIDSLPIEIQKEREYLKERDRQRGLLTTTNNANNATTEGLEETDAYASSSRENQNFDKLVERKMAHLLPPRINNEEAKAMEPFTKLHLKPNEEYNYKNESWITPPVELRHGGVNLDYGGAHDDDHDNIVNHHKCYVPKKCVARLLGHNKGVHRIRLFPKTGHLLLSAGLDGKCKVWNVLTKQVCRTYIGHSAAVRDVQFNNDGHKFLSCSFDRFVRLWETESGNVLGTYTNRRVPYIVKFYPLDDNIFVVGCSDNKIVAYDSTTGEITQEYNHHLAPVNTITFVEDHGMKMITSSDDKKILVWEWDIGVPIKYISDPTMHSIPVITLHPSGAFLAGQSLDNQIVVYQGRDRFSLQKKKKFSGHLVSGYACDIAFSPDGQFICSGDGNGKLFFWDWKRSRLVRFDIIIFFVESFYILIFILHFVEQDV